MFIGKILKQKRIEAGYSLRDLEESSGVSRTYISQIEQGKYVTPSSRVLEKLAKALDLPADRLAFEALRMLRPMDEKYPWVYNERQAAETIDHMFSMLAMKANPEARKVAKLLFDKGLEFLKKRTVAGEDLASLLSDLAEIIDIQKNLDMFLARLETHIIAVENHQKKLAEIRRVLEYLKRK